MSGWICTERKIGHIRRYLTNDATKSLVNSLVTSRSDYCNALLSGIPNTALNKLQLVQNTGARIVTRTSRHSHITPVLKGLHWLPVKYRVQYKILTHAYKAINDSSPIYIRDMVEVYKPVRNLRSTETVSLVLPKSRSVKYGNRSFVYAAPKLWNSLPVNVRNADTLTSFKKLLKTHLFLQHFNN